MKFIIQSLDDRIYYKRDFALTLNGTPMFSEATKNIEDAKRFNTKEEAETVAKESYFYYKIIEVEA